MPSSPDRCSKPAKPRRARALGLMTAVIGAFLVSIGVGPGAAAPLPGPALEDPEMTFAGPICLRSPRRPYPNLAGFSLAVGSILILAPRRDSNPSAECPGPGNDSNRC